MNHYFIMACCFVLKQSLTSHFKDKYEYNVYKIAYELHIIAGGKSVADASLHRVQCIGQRWRRVLKETLHSKKQQTALSQTLAVGKRADMTSFNKLSPPTREALCFLSGSQVFLCFCVYVCARVRSREWERCVCAYVCAFSYLWAIPHRAFSAGKDVLVWVMGVGLVLSKTLQPPWVSSTVLKLRCKTGWFA